MNDTEITAAIVLAVKAQVLESLGDFFEGRQESEHEHGADCEICTNMINSTATQVIEQRPPHDHGDECADCKQLAATAALGQLQQTAAWYEGLAGVPELREAKLLGEKKITITA